MGRRGRRRRRRRRRSAAAGYPLIGVELADGARPLHELDLPRRRRAWPSATRTTASRRPCLARCDDVAYLPQLGPIGSLNVATAAAIAMYEVRRREWTRPRPVPAPSA